MGIIWMCGALFAIVSLGNLDNSTLLGDYCATPPGPQLASTPGPLQTDDLEFIGLQVIFRHGSRTFLSPEPHCWDPMDRNFIGCGIDSEVAYTWPQARNEGSSLRTLTRTWHDYDLPGDTPIETKAAEQVTCGLGQLLDDAPAMYAALAQGLRERYFCHLSQEPTLNNSWLYATDTDRATTSLYLLLHALFPPGSSPSEILPGARLETRPSATDHWTLSSCKTARARLDLDEQVPAAHFPKFADFARRWQQAVGSEFLAPFKDCLIIAACTGEAMLRLHPALAGDEALFAEAMRVAGEMYADSYQLHNAEACRQLTAPLLLELRDFARGQARGERPRLALWGSHDTTMTAILVALGAWDRRWPPYSSSIILELYRAQSQPQRTLFRLLFQGQPLDLPACRARSEHGLYDLEDLVPPAVTEMLGRPQACDDAAEGYGIGVPSASAGPLLLSSTGTSGSLLALSFGAACFLGGVVVGRGQRRDPSADYVLMHPPPRTA